MLDKLNFLPSTWHHFFSYDHAIIYTSIFIIIGSIFDEGKKDNCNKFGNLMKEHWWNGPARADIDSWWDQALATIIYQMSWYCQHISSESNYPSYPFQTWCRHDMETLSILLAISLWVQIHQCQQYNVLMIILLTPVNSNKYKALIFIL